MALKKIILIFLLFVSSVLALDLKKDIRSTLPDKNEQVRCLFDNVSVRFNSNFHKGLLKSYSIAVYDKSKSLEISGTTTSENEFLTFYPEKALPCNTEFVADIINKKTTKKEYSWNFSTEKEIDPIYEKALENFYKSNIFGIARRGVFRPVKVITVEVGDRTIEIEKPKKKFVNKRKTVDDEKKKKILEEEAKIKEELTASVGLIKGNKWEEAKEKIEKLFEKNPDSPRVNFYMGMVAFNLKDYDSAVAAYERVLIVEPNHLIAKLELAKTLFILKMYDQSEEQFNLILQEHEDLPEPVVKNIDYFLAAIENTRKRHTLMFIAIGELKQEMLSEHKNAGDEKYNDTTHQELFIVNYSYDFGKLGGWKSNNSLIALNNDKFLCSGDDIAQNNTNHCMNGVQGYIANIGAGISGSFGKVDLTYVSMGLTAYTPANNQKKKVGVGGYDIKAAYSYPINKRDTASIILTQKNGTTNLSDLGVTNETSKGLVYELGYKKGVYKNDVLGVSYTSSNLDKTTNITKKDTNTKYLLSYDYKYNKQINILSSLLLDTTTSDNPTNTEDYVESNRKISFKGSYKYKPTITYSLGLDNEDKTKDINNPAKFIETKKGNTITMGVVYVFKPINF